jgi:hypothetical protein
MPSDIPVKFIDITVRQPEDTSQCSRFQLIMEWNNGSGLSFSGNFRDLHVAAGIVRKQKSRKLWFFRVRCQNPGHPGLIGPARKSDYIIRWIYLFSGLPMAAVEQ